MIIIYNADMCRFDPSISMRLPKIEPCGIVSGVDTSGVATSRVALLARAARGAAARRKEVDVNEITMHAAPHVWRLRTWVGLSISLSGALVLAVELWDALLGDAVVVNALMRL